MPESSEGKNVKKSHYKKYTYIKLDMGFVWRLEVKPGNWRCHLTVYSLKISRPEMHVGNPAYTIRRKTS